MPFFWRSSKPGDWICIKNQVSFLFGNSTKKNPPIGFRPVKKKEKKKE
jgi:hypothetical protein